MRRQGANSLNIGAADDAGSGFDDFDFGLALKAVAIIPCKVVPTDKDGRNALRKCFLIAHDRNEVALPVEIRKELQPPTSRVFSVSIGRKTGRENALHSLGRALWLSSKSNGVSVFRFQKVGPILRVVADDIGVDLESQQTVVGPVPISICSLRRTGNGIPSRYFVRLKKPAVFRGGTERQTNFDHIR